MTPRTGLVLLALLTAGRLWLASVLPLVPDEAYYWVWSRSLAAGYLDHPPMVALWIRLGTELAGQGALGIRLLGPVSAALGSVLLWDAAERLFPGRRAGLAAAALLNATLLMGVGAVLMTPDTPLLFFWTATLWAAARIAMGGGPAWWLIAGVCAGLAMASKYTGVFLPLGLGLFALIAMPRALRHPAPWLGVLAAALVFLPVVAWNADHGWAGFARQGGRVAHWQPERAATFLAELVAGQAGLATPGVFVLCIVGTVWAIRRTAARARDPAWMLLAALSVPPMLMFLQHAIGDRVQGNWPAIVYPAAVVAAAGLTAPAWRRWIAPSCAIGFAVTLAVSAHVVSGWPVLPGARDPAARQMFGWPDLAARVEAARLAAGADFVAAEPYGLAAELAWWLPPGSKVVAIGPHWETFALPRAPGTGRGLLIRPERYSGPPAPEDWRAPTAAARLARTWGGEDIEGYAVFLGSTGPLASVLPAR